MGSLITEKTRYIKPEVSYRSHKVDNFYTDYKNHLKNIGSFNECAETDAVGNIIQNIVDLYNGSENIWAASQ
jgi:hypothetical protein